MVNKEDPRVLRTRQLIRESFSFLLHKKGFDAITIKDIAQRAVINRATFYAHYEDKYTLLEEITEQAFYKMTPEQVMHAQEFTDEICNQLILLTHNYIVTFYKICKWDSKSIAKLVDEKIKKMLQEMIEGIFLKGNTFCMKDNLNTKIISAMTCSAIYGATYSWFKAGENDRTDLLVDIVRPYIMNGLELYRNCDV
ncbi:TetR/AcrR family transcriptional regulator [Clostridium saccharoperbutylacetonicum]|uniref:TetR/AcrR family transcriptional regulator n=1 Tax=Clostridium saccharoperbutylacetonicum TaxID=36745 RepID=UPI000983A9DB|nr:TetR/AcrR family transcriptional regulator [Clostridium saccharoperbutylacetonicum]AQR94465.1 DNA-binding transcriptional regulator EnvR [Clostridium saccharoperbutylacetonicum]NSB30171.1 AcrR family transcriptional regulator [Clostridium saccharoperbutylacetonicum]